jgi:hypothetical protein
MARKAIPYSEYSFYPTTFNLPRAIEHLRVGDAVQFDGDDVHKHDPTQARSHVDGVALADTFPYGVALVAARMQDDTVTDVWVVEAGE